MCEPESYKQVALEDLLPREYQVKIVLRRNFKDRLEKPDYSEIAADLWNTYGLRLKDVEIEEIDTV